MKPGRLLQAHNNPCPTTEPHWCAMRQWCAGSNGTSSATTHNEFCGMCTCTSSKDYCNCDKNACISCSGEILQKVGGQCIRSCESIGLHKGQRATDPCLFLTGCGRTYKDGQAQNQAVCTTQVYPATPSMALVIAASLLVVAALLVGFCLCQYRSRRARGPSQPTATNQSAVALSATSPAVVTAPQTMPVQVPPGVMAGQIVHVTSPVNGQILQYIVPPGVPPGAIFTAELPPLMAHEMSVAIPVASTPASPAVAVGIPVATGCVE